MHNQNIEDLIRQWMPMLIMGKMNSQWSIIVLPLTLFLYNYLLEWYHSYKKPKDLVSIKISHEKWSWYGMPHTMKAICWYIREVVKAKRCTYKLESEKELHKRDDKIKKILPIFSLESCPDTGINIVYIPKSDEELYSDTLPSFSSGSSVSSFSSSTVSFLSNDKKLEEGIEDAGMVRGEGPGFLKRLFGKNPQKEEENAIENKVNVKLTRIMKEENFVRLDIIVTAEKEDWIMNFINGVSQEYFHYLDKKASERKDKWVYTHAGDKWVASCPLLNKTFDNVFLDKKIHDTLIHDLDTFSKSQEYYKKIGLPYKRGYLLHGPPGTGKSSTYYAIANHTNRDLYKLSLADLNTNGFKSLIGSIPPNAVLSIDDVDRVESTNKKDLDKVVKELEAVKDLEAATKTATNANPSEAAKTNQTNEANGKDGKDDSKGKTIASLLGINISTFLEVFDGYDFLNNVIVVFTSNHPDKLDPALIRPGRADISLNIDYPNHNTLTNIFKYFFPNADVCIPTGIKNKSPAEIITRIILPNRNDYDKCIELLMDKPCDSSNSLSNVFEEIPQEVKGKEKEVLQGIEIEKEKELQVKGKGKGKDLQGKANEIRQRNVKSTNSEKEETKKSYSINVVQTYLKQE